jgi:hypothetical protein
MTGDPYLSYEAAADAYLRAFRSLRAAPNAPAATRGGAIVPHDLLVERAEEVAAVSTQMVPLFRSYLESADSAQRERISGQLLAQAGAELQLATQLLSVSPDAPVGAVTRGTGGIELQDAIRALEQAMQTPESAPRRVRGDVPRPTTVQEAAEALKQAADLTVGAITQRVSELGGDIAFDLVMQTQWSAVVEGASLARKDVAEKLEKLKEGVNALVSRAVAVAQKTILNVYDKVLALLGRDVEDRARKQVSEWLQEIERGGKIELFDALLGRLYRADAFKQELDGWLSASEADADRLNETTGKVKALSERFAALSGRLETLAGAANLAKMLQMPQVLLIVAGLQVVLLTVVVYAGYDYIGYGQGGPVDLTDGVAQTIRVDLGVEK